MNQSASDWSSFFKVLNAINYDGDEIKRMHEKLESAPKRLYRYRSVTDGNMQYREDEIRGYFFLQTNNMLNDPYDMVLTVPSTKYDYLISMLKNNPQNATNELKAHGFTDEEIYRILNTKDGFQIVRDKLRETAGEFLSVNLDWAANEMFTDMLSHLNRIFESARIACFSESYDNMPMWNNYTDDYQGICLEYDVEAIDYEHREKLYPVFYAKKFPIALEMLFKMQNFSPYERDKVIKKLLLFKSYDWRYEREWRYLDADFTEMFDSILDSECAQEHTRKVEEFFTNNPEAEEKINRFLGDHTDPDNEGERLFAELCKAAPTDLLEEKLYNSEPLKGKSIDEPPIMPTKIYLGHKIKPSHEKKILEIAQAYNIAVLKMAATDTGYVPLSLSEWAEKESRRILVKAKRLSNDEKHIEAIKVCDDAIALSPNAYAFFLRGVFYGKAETVMIKEALNNLDKATELEPTNPIYRCNKGAAYEKLSQFHLAISEYSTAIQSFHTYTRAYIRLVVTYLNIDECDMAIETIKKGYDNCDDFNERLFGDVDFAEFIQEHSALRSKIESDSVLSQNADFIQAYASLQVI